MKASKVRPSQENDLANDQIEPIVERLSYLQGRWQDEQKYEDFKDYKTNVEKLLKPMKMELLLLKRNFTTVVKDVRGYVFVFRVSPREVSYSPVYVRTPEALASYLKQVQ